VVKGRAELRREWHPVRNGELKPEEVLPFSKRMIWWKCKEGHEWEATAHSRTRGQGCPFCSGKKSDLPLCEWVSQNERIGYGKAFQKVKDVRPGRVLVEMPREAWVNLAVLTLAPEQIGKLIRQYRKRKGLNQEQFAGSVGRSRNYIAQLEEGRSDRVSYKVFQKIISTVLE